MNGALKWDAIVDVVDSVIKVLGRAGFDPVEAMTAFDTVAQCAVGAAVQEIRGRGSANEGRSLLSELHRMIASRPQDELVGLRSLLDVPPIRMTPNFEDHLTTVLVGIAVRRGDEWAPVSERGMRAPRATGADATGNDPDSLSA